MQKSARFPEGEIHTVGGNEALPAGDARPDPSWTLERLAVYAKDEVSNSFLAEQEAILQAHKSAVHLFRAGHAFALAREKCKGEQHGLWTKFKKKHGLADTTANDAIRLYESAKTEDALAGFGITEAKVKFGIAKPKKPKRAASHQAGSRQPGTNPSAGDPDTKAEADADPDHEDAGESKEKVGPSKGGHHESEPPEKAGEETEEPDHEESDESPLNHKKVVIRLVSDSDKDAIRTAVADYSPVVKTATGVRLVAFVVSPRRLGKALQALFKSLVKIESFNLEVQ